MKRFFLIDLENVGSTFTKGIDKLTIADTLIICHNMTIKNSFKETIERELLNTKAMVKRLEIANVSKNAMDFELMIQLGYLMREHGSSAQYYIVSNDTGFDVAADFPKHHEEIKNVQVRRIISLEANFSEEERIKALEDEIAAILPDYPKKVVKIVRTGLDNSRTTVQLNNFLQKHLFHDFQDIFPKVKHLLDLEKEQKSTQKVKNCGNIIKQYNKQHTKAQGKRA